MLERGADVNLTVGDGLSPLHLAVWSGDAETVETLVNKSADTNAVTESGTTPLHFAPLRGHQEATKTLVSHGADINAIDNCRGTTPLHLAASGGHAEVVDTLISHNADIDVSDKQGARPIHCAAHHGQGKVVEVLLRSRVNTSHGWKIGTVTWSALDLAEARGHHYIAKLLQQHGVPRMSLGARLSIVWSLVEFSVTRRPPYALQHPAGRPELP